jgi:imidazoleglycerol-phosphate dehydratase
MEPTQRKVTIERKTNETKISLKFNLDGKGEYDVFTGIGFFDHMLIQIAKHGFMDITLNAEGDIEVDYHHTVEDVGIVIGKALSEALSTKEGIRRYGSVMLPMEDALVICAVDFSGRPYLGYDVAFSTERIGGLDTEMIEEFFRAVCFNSGLNMHIKLLAGKNSHHIAEAVFKAFGKAVEQAVRFDPRTEGVLSTKGVLA